MSRISVFNLSFDIRADTIEQITTFAVGLSWFLHVQCNAFTEFCLRYAKSRAFPHCQAHESFVALPVLIAQYSLCLSSSKKHSFNKKSPFRALRSCFVKH